MLSFARAASSPTAMSTDEPKSFSAPTQPVYRAPFPRAGLFTSVVTSLVSNASAPHATLRDPNLTKISGQPTKKPSHPSLKPQLTPPNTDLALASLLTLRNFPTLCHQQVTTNHLLTPSKTSPPKDLITNHSTSTSQRKTHIFSHNWEDYHKSSPLPF